MSLQKTMSTANVQNLLSNVFHPTFVYDSGNQVFKSKLELVNIDTVSANTVSTFFASVGDPRSNVYVGIGAGNPYSNMSASSNWYSTFVGAGAGNGSSNISNCVFLGYNAGQGSVNSTNTIAIGSNVDGDGSNNIYIGAGTGMLGAAGTSNIFIGHGNTLTGVTKQFLLGPLVAQPGGSLTNSLAPNYLLGGDFASNRLGINLSNPTYNLDVNGYARIGTNSVGGLGINTNPVDYTLNVNGDMQVSDGYGRLRVTHDASGVSRTTLVGITNSGGLPPAVGIATLQVSDGYFSASGTTTAGGTATAPFKKGLIMISAGNSSSVSESYIVHSADAVGAYMNIVSHSTSGSNIPIFPTALFTFTVGANSTTQTFTGLSGGIIVPGMVITYTGTPGGSGGGISTTTYITAVNMTSATQGTITVSTAFNSTSSVYYNTVFPTTTGNAITFANGNIVFSNAAALNWSVTYFPTP